MVTTTAPPPAPTGHTGTEAKVRRPDAAGYGHGRKLDAFKQAAIAAGMNPDTLAKAWKASRFDTEAPIKELWQAVRKHHARFGPTHLTRVMAVARLGRAVQAIPGRRDHVGKQPTVPADPAERLHALAAVCVRWERFCVAAGDPSRSTTPTWCCGPPRPCRR